MRAILLIFAFCVYQDALAEWHSVPGANPNPVQRAMNPEAGSTLPPKGVWKITPGQTPLVNPAEIANLDNLTTLLRNKIFTRGVKPHLEEEPNWTPFCFTRNSSPIHENTYYTRSASEPFTRDTLVSRLSGGKDLKFGEMELRYQGAGSPYYFNQMSDAVEGFEQMTRMQGRVPYSTEPVVPVERITHFSGHMNFFESDAGVPYGIEMTVSNHFVHPTWNPEENYPDDSEETYCIFAPGDEVPGDLNSVIEELGI